MPVSNTFAFNLFAALVAQQPGRNVFVSPTSVLLALALAYNGASGETERELAAALDGGDMDRDEFNRACQELVAALEAIDPALTLAIANAAWLNQHVPVQDAFVERAATFFRADVQHSDFGDQRTVQAVNAWVAAHTNGKITQIIDRIDPATLALLVNAIYFKGRWSTPFEPRNTRDLPFMLAGGGYKQIPMMRRAGTFRYLETDSFQAVCLPYGAEKMGMYLFLPAKKSSMAALQRALSAEQWAAWMGQFRRSDGSVTVPRFKLEYEVQLIPVLRQLGIAAAFDARRADFSAMAGRMPAYIGAVIHKTYVDVNEEGTEAAAVTALHFMAAGFMPSKRFVFTADRPFVCAIVEEQSATPLFLGAIMDPVQ